MVKAFSPTLAMQELDSVAARSNKETTVDNWLQPHLPYLLPTLMQECAEPIGVAQENDPPAGFHRRKDAFCVAGNFIPVRRFWVVVARSLFLCLLGFVNILGCALRPVLILSAVPERISVRAWVCVSLSLSGVQVQARCSTLHPSSIP